jgi:hypothetical protein
MHTECYMTIHAYLYMCKSITSFYSHKVKPLDVYITDQLTFLADEDHHTQIDRLNEILHIFLEILITSTKEVKHSI